MNNKKISPIIIIGMHRSGTSMLSDLLKKLGLFTGNKLGSHAEADFFLKLNDWLLNQTGSSWDNPYNLEKIYSKENEDEFNSFVQFLKSVVSSPLYFKYKGLNSNEVWGFKDPVSSLTLPFWMSVYPNAKVIYIKRHGLDVSQSLYIRNKVKFEKAKNRFKNKSLYPYYLMYKQFYSKDKRNRGFIDSINCKDIMYGLKLWDYYNAKCLEYIEAISKENKISVVYEDLLTYPEKELGKLVKFIGLKHDSNKITKISKNINSKKAFTYKKKFSESEIPKFEEFLKKHNY